MKKIYFILAFLLPFATYSQIKISALPTKTSNFLQGDNIIINDSAAGTGATKKISIRELKANYDLGSGGGGSTDTTYLSRRINGKVDTLTQTYKFGIDNTNSYRNDGGSVATGGNSTALGSYSSATGYYSSSVGGGSIAAGDNSTAIGWSSSADSIGTISIGTSSHARGNYSVTIGAGITGTDDSTAYVNKLNINTPPRWASGSDTTTNKVLLWNPSTKNVYRGTITGGGGSTDTTYLSNRINTKLAYSDTSYLHNQISKRLITTNNLSDVSSKATSRINLGIDKLTRFGNSNRTILATDKYVIVDTFLTAGRTYYLPLANSVNAGYEVIIEDKKGAIGTYTITISRSGTDSINGGLTEVIGQAYGMRRLFSDGVSKWSFDKGVLRASNNLSDVATPATARTNLGLAIGTNVASQTDTRFGYQVQAIFGSFSPADATTYYFGNYAATNPQTTAGTRKIYFTTAGTITKVYGFFFQSGLGSTETSTLSIRLNNTTDYDISTAIVNNVQSTAFNNTAMSVPIAAGDYIELKWVTPTWATNPTGCYPIISIYLQQ